MNMSEKNVLLLAMSILGKNLRECVNYYIYEDKQWIFKGISQLEPGTKLVLSLLEGEHKIIDKIVILATPETKNDGSDFSSVDFYIEKIKMFIQNGEKNEKKEELHELNDLTVNKYKPLIEKNTLFEVISLEEKDYLLQAVQAIQGEKRTSASAEKINLYIDMQGSRRSEMTQMNAIIELLKSNNLEIKGRYAIDYNPSCKERKHPIKEVSDEYEMSNLVTAMEIFRKYGRGEELNKFFDKETSAYEKKLSEFIVEVSDAIQLCDVKAFDIGISNISKMIDAGMNEDDNVIYNIVCKEIKDDYMAIIQSNNDKQNKYITQVEWCLEKGFIQQALTIIESQMPKEIINYSFFQNDLLKKEVEYSESKWNKKKKRYELCTDIETASLEDCVKKSKKEWEDTENFIFRKWAEYIFDREYGELLKKNTEIVNKAKQKCNRNDFKIRWKEGIWFVSKPIQLLDNNEKITDEFLYFIGLHMNLKNQRNMANHASSGERATVKEIEDAIQSYVKLAKKLSCI